MTQAQPNEWALQLLEPGILQRDAAGFGLHPAIPKHLDESIDCVAEFAEHGIELRPISIEDDILDAELDEMNAKGDWRTWCPIPPEPDNAWRLIAVFDTDDGPRAWWVRPIQTNKYAGCVVADGTHKPAQELHQITEPQKFTGDSEMRRAFETEHGQNWEDPEWRHETGLWASAWHKATAVAALGIDKRAFPPMTPELASILGLMCFQCISFAQALRAAGHTIKTSAEDEQAAVLHWMLGHYCRHGEDWRTAAAEDMKRMEAAALAAQAKQRGAA